MFNCKLINFQLNIMMNVNVFAWKYISGMDGAYISGKYDLFGNLIISI